MSARHLLPIAATGDGVGDRVRQGTEHGVHVTADPGRAERVPGDEPVRGRARLHRRARQSDPACARRDVRTIGGGPRASTARHRRSTGRSPGRAERAGLADRLRDGQHPRRRGRRQGGRAAPRAAPDAWRSAAAAAVGGVAVRADLQRRRQREGQPREPVRAVRARWRRRHPRERPRPGSESRLHEARVVRGTGAGRRRSRAGIRTSSSICTRPTARITAIT